MTRIEIKDETIKTTKYNFIVLRSSKDLSIQEQFKSQILSDYEIVNIIQDLPIELILQHIRDSFTEDGSYIPTDVLLKTTKAIEDLEKIQKLRDGKK